MYLTLPPSIDPFRTLLCVPALQRVSTPSILPIVVLAISRQRPLHCAADRILCALHQQVNLIRHQAVSIEPGTAVSPLYQNRCDGLRVILRRVKDELAVITSSVMW